MWLRMPGICATWASLMRLLATPSTGNFAGGCFWPMRKTSLDGTKWAPRNGSGAYDGRLAAQPLNDGFDLAIFGFAFDLIYNLPSFTAEEKAKVRDNFFRPAVAPLFNATTARDYLSTPDNRSLLCASAVLICGYATDDRDMVDFALYGHAGTKLPAVVTEGIQSAVTTEAMASLKRRRNAPGGLMNVHFTPQCLLPDGWWCESALGYVMTIVSCGLFNAAEVLWHHGVDMYRYRNGALKRLLDSEIALASPDETLTLPALKDTYGPSPLMSKHWLGEEVGACFNCGYRRYRDPHYLPIIQNANAHLEQPTHCGPPFIKDHLPELPASWTKAMPCQNVNFFSTGYGVLRVRDGARTNSLLMEYGSNFNGHDQPGMLGIDLYAWHGQVMPCNGWIGPTIDPHDGKRDRSTLGHSTMVVDEEDQLYFCSYTKYVGVPRPPATETIQLVYAPAATLGMQRAYSRSIYPGTTLDRSLFLTSRYMVDLFRRVQFGAAHVCVGFPPPGNSCGELAAGHGIPQVASARIQCPDQCGARPDGQELVRGGHVSWQAATVLVGGGSGDGRSLRAMVILWTKKKRRL